MWGSGGVETFLGGNSNDTLSWEMVRLSNERMEIQRRRIEDRDAMRPIVPSSRENWTGDRI